MKNRVGVLCRKIACVVIVLVIALGALPTEPVFGRIWLGPTDLLGFEESLQKLIDSGDEVKYTFTESILHRYAMLPKPKGVSIDEDVTITLNASYYGNTSGIHSIRSYRSNCHMEFIVAEGCTLTLVFENIKLEGDGGGGGIKVTGGGDLALENAWIVNCTTFPSGGAILNEEGNVHIKNSKFASNKALTGSGGVVFARGAKLENCVFEENSADADGGAVTVTGGGLTVTGSKFIGNSAAVNGGAIAVEACDAMISNSVFKDNGAEDKGSVVYADAPAHSLDLVDCELTGDPDETLHTTGNLTLLHDKAAIYTVTFESSNGGNIPKQRVAERMQVVQPEEPVREGYRFSGWYTDQQMQNPYNFNTPVTSSFTLYAGWQEVAEATEQEHAAYVNGYADGTFRPDETLTRAEAAAMFGSLAGGGMAGDPQYSLGDDSPYGLAGDPQYGLMGDFSDVSAAAWYYEQVMKLVRQGVVSGYSDGTFRPEKTVTRAEFATMALHFTGGGESGKQFKFSDLAGDHWAARTIMEATGGGYLSGYPNGTFGPEQSITRAEAVAVINRIKGCGEIREGAGFTDVPESHWAFEAISAASADHSHAE